SFVIIKSINPTRFVPQTELSTEQAFWSPNSSDPSPSCRPTKVEVPKELLKSACPKYLSLNGTGCGTTSFRVKNEKVLVITALKDELRKLKGKALVDNAVMKHTIDPEMLKNNVEPITPKLLNNRTAHSAYIKHTQEEVVVLGGIVKHVKANYPLDHPLKSVCRYTKQIQDLLTNISNTYPSINNSGEKLVAMTPKNMDKRVRFTKPVTSSGNTNTKTASSSNLVPNKPMLSSTGVKPSTSASESQPSGNTKKDKIQQTPKAVATACYTQNRSIVRLRHGKTPYELLHDKLPNLSFFHVFGALCYPTNDSENLGKLQPKADIGIFIGYAPTKKAFRIYNRRTRRIIETIHVDFDELTAMASEHSSSGPALHEMTPAIISSGLVPNPPPLTPFVPPSRTDWDILFQPLFDELLTPPPSVDHPAPEVIAPIAEVVAPEPAASTGSPSSTTVDQDAPSPSNSQTTPETQSPIIPNDVEEDNHDLDVAHMNNDPFFGIPIPENDSEASSSSDVIPTVVQSAAPYSEHEQALFCYYDAFLTSVEPKNYKDALTQACWIEAMQEELNEFERLEVWELVPRLDKVMVITLKWIYKVKLDELGGILKESRLRLVAHGYRSRKRHSLKQAFTREVYVSQPNEFVDQDNLNHVYKLKKALYGLKQAPHACLRGIFINQSKYALESLKKYGMESSDPVDTLMVEKSKLDEDIQGKSVDPTHYHGMIGTLMYLTASRTDLTFVVCMCARYQTKPTEKHLYAVKRILYNSTRNLIWDSSVSKRILPIA
ncbi:putative ribonuclease H-like domain-containing protein, partial [Tanacetum coccineum]